MFHSSHQFEEYINEKEWREESVSIVQIRRSKQQQSPRRRTDHSYEVRVEGRSTEGFISFKCNLRKLVLPRVGTLNTRDLVLPRVGALRTRELVLPPSPLL
jgi:hypothetical protein